MSKTDVDAGECAAPYLKAFNKQQRVAQQPSRQAGKSPKGVLAHLREERYV
jgi:hypothetical protein